MNADAIVPAHDECVLRYLLDRRAQDTPDKDFAVIPGGARLTYADARTAARRIGRALQDLGVKQGDHIVVWMPNSLESLTFWFAINYIGAVCIPVNTAYKGGILEHVLRNSAARLLIGHPTLVRRLEDIDTAALQTVVVTEPDPAPIGHLETLPVSALDATKDPLPLERDIGPWDTQLVIYTSGTTGPSKGVLSSYCHMYTMATSVVSTRHNVPRVGAEDRFMINMPLFHVGGVAPSYAMLVLGGSVTLLSGFETGTFWRDAKDTGVTAVILLGVMTSFIIKQGHVAESRDSPLRLAICIPFTSEAITLRESFGIETQTLFNMSEVSCPIIAEDNPTQPGVCGRARDGVELRLVNANDCEVAQGETGELVIRTTRPWGLTHGYLNNAEATAAAFRNGWFHTGDAFRQDDEGNYYFVDRFKDAIRRRGENVSSFEVEAEVTAHPAIREAAAVAVDSEYSEDEILVAVSFADGKSVTMEDLIAFLEPRMAHFMVPRYIRVLDDLPKTPTQKVEKYLIRNAGVTDETWDREAAGIKIRREKLSV